MSAFDPRFPVYCDGCTKPVNECSCIGFCQNCGGAVATEAEAASRTVKLATATCDEVNELICKLCADEEADRQRKFMDDAAMWIGGGGGY